MRFNPQLAYEWYAEEIKDPPWLIEGLVPADALIRLSGPRKLGKKSFLAILVASILSSNQKHGILKPVSSEPTRVLYLQEEGPRASTQARLGGVWRGMGIDPEAEPERVAKLMENFYWQHRSGIKLDNPSHVSKLKDWALANGIKLIILDALTYMHTGDEDKNRDMQKVNNALLDLRQAGIAVLYISHTGKTADREGADIDLAARGASILNDAYDAHLAIRIDRQTNSRVLLTRFRDAGEGEYRLTWDFQDNPFTVTGRVIPRTEANYLQEVVDYLAEQGGMQVGQKYSFAQFRSVLNNMEVGPAMALRSKLVDAGLIQEPKEGKGIIIS